MNIEHKNTIFIISLLLVVLASMSVISYYLFGDHVRARLTGELDEAHSVFVEAQKNSLRTLVSKAQAIAAEPALPAVLAKNNIPNIEALLQGLYTRMRLDLVALYLNKPAATVLAKGRKEHYTTPRVMKGDEFAQLAAAVTQGLSNAYSHTFVVDTLLRVVAVPVQDAAGVIRGVLIVGEELGERQVNGLKNLARVDIVLYASNLVLVSTLPASDTPPLHRLPSADELGLITFGPGNDHYIGRLYPILQSYPPQPVSHIMLAKNASELWAPYLALGKNTLLFSLLVLLAAALAGILVSRASLTRPLKALAKATVAVSTGDFTIEQQLSKYTQRQDEFGKLARAFHKMTLRLSSSQSELERNRQRFQDFANSTSDWFWETDVNAQFTYVSPSVAETLGFNADELVGRYIKEIFPHDHLDELAIALKPMGDRPKPFRDTEIWVISGFRVRQCLSMNGVPIFKDGTFIGFRGTAKDITKAKYDEEKLIRLATQDHLTGLANRHSFMQDLGRVISGSARQGRPGTLMLIDLDHLKLINDTAGHAAGDEVILQIAALLRRLTRSEDIVARLSGDEFVIAFPDMSAERAVAKGQQIVEQINELKPVTKGKAQNITASVGVALFPEHGTDVIELLSLADTAMYAAKSRGRNCVYLYSDSDMSRELLDSQLAWKDRIHRALQDDLFELVYQPIVPAAGGTITHYEVLTRIRWHDGTEFMPGSFIPTAEKFGLIKQVDRVIVAKAIDHLASLPIADDPVCFSINLSGLSVGDPAVLQLIERKLDESGLWPERITFEITETAACENMSKALDFIGRVRQLGCHIALDDFGVGFSSFSYLKHLRVDKIKIDGAFVRNIHHSSEDQLFVKALIDVAKGLGIQTIAEFVETQQVLDMVRELGVDFVQGYYLGKPSHTVLTQGQARAQVG